MRANRLMYAENISLLFDPSNVSAQTSDSHSWGSWSCLRAWGHGTRLELSDASNGEKTIAPESLLSCSYHRKCTMKDKPEISHSCKRGGYSINRNCSYDPEPTSIPLENPTAPFSLTCTVLMGKACDIYCLQTFIQKNVCQVTAWHSGWTSEDSHCTALHLAQQTQLITSPARHLGRQLYRKKGLLPADRASRVWMTTFCNNEVTWQQEHSTDTELRSKPGGGKKKIKDSYTPSNLTE